MDNIFIGSALAEVSDDGRLTLPGFVRATALRRSSDKSLFVGLHETAPCLIIYHGFFARSQFEENERQRPSRMIGAHHVLSRRVFGLAQRIEFNTMGELTLPPLLRARSAIGEHALFISAGSYVEIWDPTIAVVRGDADLATLAHFFQTQAIFEAQDDLPMLSNKHLPSSASALIRASRSASASTAGNT